MAQFSINIQLTRIKFIKYVHEPIYITTSYTDICSNVIIYKKLRWKFGLRMGCGEIFNFAGWLVDKSGMACGLTIYVKTLHFWKH
jgi:hypothetical protein